MPLPSGHASVDEILSGGLVGSAVPRLNDEGVRETVAVECRDEQLPPGRRFGGVVLDRTNHAWAAIDKSNAVAGPEVLRPVVKRVGWPPLHAPNHTDDGATGPSCLRRRHRFSSTGNQPLAYHRRMVMVHDQQATLVLVVLTGAQMVVPVEADHPDHVGSDTIERGTASRGLPKVTRLGAG